MGRGCTHAEKSADPVAANVASEERRACQTAPLWPMKVPILGVVSGFTCQCLEWICLPVARNAISKHRVIICSILASSYAGLNFAIPLHADIK